MVDDPVDRLADVVNRLRGLLSSRCGPSLEQVEALTLAQEALRTELRSQAAQLVVLSEAVAELKGMTA